MRTPSHSMAGAEWAVYRRVLAYARPYWARLVLGALCSILFAGSFTGMLLSAQPLLAHLIQPQAEKPSEVAEVAGPVPPPPEVAGEAAPDDPSARLARAAGERREVQMLRGLMRYDAEGLGATLQLAAVFFVWIVVYSLGAFLSTYLLQWVGQRVVMDLRIGLFGHLQRLPVAFFSSTRTGEMISRTVSDTQVLQHGVSNVITDLIRQPVMLLVLLSYVIFFEWRLALGGVLLLPLCVVPVLLIGRRMRRISREGQQRLADLTSVMQESLTGVWVVKAFGQEAREHGRFSAQCRHFFGRMVSAMKARALNDPIAHTVGGIGFLGVMIYAKLVGMPFERCATFAFALWGMYEPIKKLGRLHMEIQHSSAAAERVFEILDTPATVVDRPGATPLVEPLRELVFDRVGFRYDGESPREVFRDLRLRIPAGQSLALVGPSGCGKTTLVSLLLRFFDVTEGSIRYNDTDLRDCTVSSLRAHIGLVMQDTFLFADTVEANIAYGKPDATREQVEDAARRANADGFIRELPQGYATRLGERGSGLSGGQRQRLAIARAILRHPPILILDEATSALDTQAERMVQADIEKLMGQHTVIVIAHRLSTIVRCDRIAVLGQGGILEYGTHAELLALGGVYRELHDLQFATESHGGS